MTYNVITQEGMVVGSQKTLEDARDLAEDIDGVIVDENNNVIPEQEEVKTSIELYSKIQMVIDEIDSFSFLERVNRNCQRLFLQSMNDVRLVF